MGPDAADALRRFAFPRARVLVIDDGGGSSTRYQALRRRILVAAGAIAILPTRAVGALVAHELAHDVLRHYKRRLCSLWRLPSPRVCMRYMRFQELEADAFAAWICGVEPMIRALELMTYAMIPTPGPDFHPSLEARISHLRRLL